MLNLRQDSCDVISVLSLEIEHICLEPFVLILDVLHLESIACQVFAVAHVLEAKLVHLEP